MLKRLNIVFAALLAFLGSEKTESSSEYLKWQRPVLSYEGFDKIDHFEMQKGEDVYLALISLFDARNDKRVRILDRFPSFLPSEGYITSGYGMRKTPGNRRTFHGGIDLASPYGSPIYAAATGIVIKAFHSETYGKVVEIDHGNGMVTKYAHASRLLVKKGDRVARGDIIAKVGNTGRSRGIHLHFEVIYNGKRVNPEKFLFEKRYRSDEYKKNMYREIAMRKRNG